MGKNLPKRLTCLLDLTNKGDVVRGRFLTRTEGVSNPIFIDKEKALFYARAETICLGEGGTYHKIKGSEVARVVPSECDEDAAISRIRVDYQLRKS